MISALNIFDGISPNGSEGTCLLWDKFAHLAGHISILTIQEQYFYETRSEFLRFIHNFGEYSIDGEKLRDHLRLTDGFSAWWISSIFDRHPANYGDALFEVFKLRALERYLSIQKIETVHFYSDNIVLFKAIKSIATALNIQCYHHAVREQSLRRKVDFFSRLKAYFKSTYMGRVAIQARNFLRWWLRERSQFPASPRLQKTKGLLLGTWFPNIDAKAAAEGRFRSRYWEGVHDLLEDTLQPIHWFFIYSDTAEKISENIALRDTFVSHKANIDMTFCEECISPREACRAFMQWLCIAWKAQKITPYVQGACQWPDSAINVHDFIENLWFDSTCGDALFKNLIFREGIKKYCRLVGLQDTVITSSELQVWERLLFSEQRRQGCQKVYAAQHSVIRDADFRFFVAPEMWKLPEFTALMPDLFFCNGDAALAVMRKTGFPEQRLGMLEAVRFMFLANSSPCEPSPPTRLLVATSYFPREAEATLKTLASALRISDLALLKNIIVKAHPDLPVDDLLQRYFDVLPQIVYEPIETYLTADTAVYIDSATSVGLLVLYKGLQLIVHAPENSFDMGTLQDIHNLRVVHNSKELIDELQTNRSTKICENYFYLDASKKRWHELLKVYLNGN